MKKMKKTKTWWIAACVIVAAMLCPIVYVRYGSQKNKPEAAYYPVVYTAYREDGQKAWITKVEGGNGFTGFTSSGGFSLPDEKYRDTAARYADFEICFPASSSKITQGPVLRLEKQSAHVQFHVQYTETLSGVQVLRWPFSEFGTTAPLDSAERIAYVREGDENEFVVEKGYLYSIYVTWSNCFRETVFQVR